MGPRRGGGKAEAEPSCVHWQQYNVTGISIDKRAIPTSEKRSAYVGSTLRACRGCRLIFTSDFIRTELTCPNCGPYDGSWMDATAGGLDYSGYVNVQHDMKHMMESMWSM